MNKKHIKDRNLIFMLLVLMVLPLGVICPLSNAEKNEDTFKRIDRTLEMQRDSLFELHRDLHSHPEVSGNEERTARVITDRLRALGLEVRSGVGGHGVIGLLVGGKPGPVVAYRADMDAVHSDAPDPVPHRSQTPGVRHICGHDVHTTVAVGIAEALASLQEVLPGTVKFIFQPSEENAQGAKAVIDDGALENPVPDAIFAVHSAPLEVGQFGTTEGMLLAELDILNVILSGKGDLRSAARASAKVVSDVNTVGPMGASQGAGEASAENSVGNDFILATVYDREENPEIPRITLRIMIRASSDKNSEKAGRDIQSGLEKLDMADITHKVEFSRGVVPAVINDPVLASKAMETIRKLRGEEGLVVIDETTPFFSEDFAFFLQKIPGVMSFLGVSNTNKGIVGMPHSPQFAVDEEAIIIGAKTMAAVLWDYLVTK